MKLIIYLLFYYLINYVNLYHEILTFHSFCLMKLNNKKEIYLFVKFNLNYIQNEKKKKKKK